MSAGTFSDMLSAWGQNESGNNYGFISSLGFLGRYQFSEEGLQAIGWYSGDDNPHNMDFVASWTSKAAAFGVNDKWSFMASPAAQDAAVAQWFDYLVSDIVRLGLTSYLGQTLNGVPITMSGMLTGGSLVGVWALKSYLESGATVGGSDWYGTNVGEYVSRFGGYDTPYDYLGPAATDKSAPPTIVQSASAPESTVPVSGDGQVYWSSGPGSTLHGSAGGDILHVSEGYDVVTGGAGADLIVCAREPWAPITVTDFAVGVDKLDFSELFRAAGYSASDPVGDGYIRFQADGASTLVLFDRDASGGGQPWANYVLKLEGVRTDGLTWGELASRAASAPPQPSGESGQSFGSNGPYSWVTGTAGADTIYASEGYDVLTGAEGGDHFVFGKEPWGPIEIADFQPGADKLDLRQLFDALGYTGTSPFQEGYLFVQSDGDGGTQVLLDRDLAGPAPEWANYIIHLPGVAPGTLSAGDWLFQ